MTEPKKPKLCPHCGKDTRLTPKPRDLGLLLHLLVFRVPIEEQITEAWIEIARKHCRMTPERLAVLRAEPHARHWHSLTEKRQRRLDWAKAHNGQAPAFIPPAPGERDHRSAVIGMRTYWKKVRPMISKMKKRPAAQWTKLANRYETAMSGGAKSAESILALTCEDNLTVHLKAMAGTLTVQDLVASKNALTKVIAPLPPISDPANTGQATEKDGLCAPEKLPVKSCGTTPVVDGPTGAGQPTG
jgi:hypothetical protein